jgi:hypothetical protein
MRQTVDGIADPMNARMDAAGSLRPQDALLCDMTLPYRRMFYPLGYPVEIATNDTVVLDEAHKSIGHGRPRRVCPTLQIRVGVSRGGAQACPPEPTRREFNHLYSLVADGDNQAMLDLRSGANFTWVTSAAVHSGMYFRSNFLEKVVYLLLGALVVTDLHAACVSKNGRGFLLFGDSGAGKSTLAYGCARAGWTYTSDDTSYLINDSKITRVIGHSHRARFRPSAKLLFPELERFELTPRMEGKPSIEVSIAELPVEKTATEATVDCIVYLNRHSSSRVGLIRLPHGTATERACRELYSAGEIRVRHERILERLAVIPTYELEYCDLNGGIRELERLSHGE